MGRSLMLAGLALGALLLAPRLMPRPEAPEVALPEECSDPAAETRAMSAAEREHRRQEIRRRLEERRQERNR